MVFLFSFSVALVFFPQMKFLICMHIRRSVKPRGKIGFSQTTEAFKFTIRLVRCNNGVPEKTLKEASGLRLNLHAK